ncbi:MAG: class I SAM-dependent methyltransferase, partial [Anaerolineales bacterium]|nr:class I SAM-dependent methyltransferase [Anaerolineales bacterium]
MQTFLMLFAGFILLIALLYVLVPAWYGLPPISTHPDRIRKALKLANLQPNETLYDLGSGHGQVLMIAAKEFGANAVGVEVGPVQCFISWVNCLRSGVRSKVRIEAGNFFKVNLEEADVIFAYLTSEFGERLQEKMQRELKTGARVVTVAFEIPVW